MEHEVAIDPPRDEDDQEVENTPEIQLVQEEPEEKQEDEILEPVKKIKKIKKKKKPKVKKTRIEKRIVKKKVKRNVMRPIIIIRNKRKKIRKTIRTELPFRAPRQTRPIFAEEVNDFFYFEPPQKEEKMLEAETTNAEDNNKLAGENNDSIDTSSSESENEDIKQEKQEEVVEETPKEESVNEPEESEEEESSEEESSEDDDTSYEEIYEEMILQEQGEPQTGQPEEPARAGPQQKRVKKKKKKRKRHKKHKGEHHEENEGQEDPNQVAATKRRRRKKKKRVKEHDIKIKTGTQRMKRNKTYVQSKKLAPPGKRRVRRQRHAKLRGKISGGIQERINKMFSSQNDSNLEGEEVKVGRLKDTFINQDVFKTQHVGGDDDEGDEEGLEPSKVGNAGKGGPGAIGEEEDESGSEEWTYETISGEEAEEGGEGGEGQSKRKAPSKTAINFRNLPDEDDDDTGSSSDDDSDVDEEDLAAYKGITDTQLLDEAGAPIVSSVMVKKLQKKEKEPKRKKRRRGKKKGIAGENGEEDASHQGSGSEDGEDSDDDSESEDLDEAALYAETGLVVYPDEEPKKKEEEEVEKAVEEVKEVLEAEVVAQEIENEVKNEQEKQKELVESVLIPQVVEPEEESFEEDPDEPRGPSILFEVGRSNFIEELGSEIEVDGSEEEVEIEQEVETEVETDTEEEFEVTIDYEESEDESEEEEIEVIERPEEPKEEEIVVVEQPKEAEEDPLSQSKIQKQFLSQFSLVGKINPEESLTEPPEKDFDRAPTITKDLDLEMAEDGTGSPNQDRQTQKGDEELKNSMISTGPKEAKKSSRKYEGFSQDQVKAIKKYIIKNKDIHNPVVRSAEIDAKLYRDLRSKPLGELEGSEKLLMYLYQPIHWLTYFTILPTSNKQFHRLRYLAWPLLGVPFLFYILTAGLFAEESFFIYFGIYTGIGIVVALGLFWRVFSQNEAPKGGLKGLSSTLGVAGSLAWMWLLCDMLVSLIKTLHVVFNFQYTFMMIGMFSFFIWTPISFSSLKLVQLLRSMPGYSDVVFNCFFVFGLSTLLQTLVYGDQAVEFFPHESTQAAIEASIYIVLCILIVAMSIILLKAKGWRFTGFLGLVLVSLYNLGILYTCVDGFLAI